MHGGLYPIRPEGVHPDFPVWGTGKWEWQKGADGKDRFLTTHPNDINPSRGYAVSWNNRPAPDWAGSDAQWGWSSLYRADLLEDQLLGARPRSITPVKLVQMMEQAGLSDLRGTHVLPQAFEMLKAAEPPTPEAAAARDALVAWVEGGALRRDGDGDGSYDAATAVGLMDAWWEPMIRTIYDPVLGDVGTRSPVGFHNAPSSTGSAFQDGFYGQVWTDLSMVLGEEFLPTAALSMQWVNRPTTQSIAMFGRLGGAVQVPPAIDRPGPGPLPATGPAPWVGLGVLVLLLAVALTRRRQVSSPDTEL